MQICKELGLTLQQGMELSVFEIKLWVAYFNQVNDMQRESLNAKK